MPALPKNLPTAPEGFAYRWAPDGSHVQLVVAPEPTTPEPTSTGEAQRRMWDSVKRSSDIDVLTAFLEAFPAGSLAELARARIEELEKKERKRKEERQRARSSGAGGHGSGSGGHGGP